MPFRKKFWYWNLETHQPEFGRMSRTEKLLGPYRSREEAEQAPKIIRERNAQWVKEQRDRDREAAREQARKRVEQGKDPQPTRTSAHGSQSSPNSHTNSRGTTHTSDSNSNESKDSTADRWLSWKEFLEQPSLDELNREEQSGSGSSVPPAFFGDTSAIGVVGDDEHGTFEQRLERFERDRHDFTEHERLAAQKRKEDEKYSEQQAKKAIDENKKQARKLLDDQQKELPGAFAHSLHVWKGDEK